MEGVYKELNTMHNQLDDMLSEVGNTIDLIDTNYSTTIDIDYFNEGPSAAIRYCVEVMRQIRKAKNQLETLEKCFYELDKITFRGRWR